MKKCLWLDDLRNPNDDEWKKLIPIDYQSIWVKTWTEFTLWINENGLPDLVSFDHDLGETKDSKDGKDCANWLVDQCLDLDVNLPQWQVHSMNSVGKENIRSLLKGYTEFYARKNKN